MGGISNTLSTLGRLYRSGILEVYYTPFNLLEIIGKISRINYDKNIVQKGLSIIIEEFNNTIPTIKGYMEALELKRRGFKDLIDLLLYTTAKTRNLKFLTRDLSLIKFLEEIGEDTRSILSEEEFLEEYGGSSNSFPY